METAKDILEKHGVRIFGAQQNRIVDAMKEIADKVHSYYKAKYNDNCECEICQTDYREFMKELFPEADIKDPSAVGS